MRSGGIRSWLCVLIAVPAASCATDVADDSEHEAQARLVAPVSCEPQTCRAVARTSVPHVKIAEALSVAEDRADLGAANTYRTGDAISILPAARRAWPGNYLRVAQDGKLSGANLSGIYADAFLVAGSTAEQVAVLQGGTAGASTMRVDLATGQLGERRAVNNDVNYFSQTRQAAAAPALDGTRSVFAIGNIVIGPLDVGVVGADATLAGPPTRVCGVNDKDCGCLSVIPTESAGMVSMVEEPADPATGVRAWRVLTLDATGKIVKDASVSISGRTGCPLVAASPDGLVALLHGKSGDELLRFDDPEHPTPLRSASGGSAGRVLDFGFSGRDALLVQYTTDKLTVVRAVDGVVEEKSRLALPGARDLSIVPGATDQALLSYDTESSQELVSVSCR
jgi:hypothetical protein